MNDDDLDKLLRRSAPPAVSRVPRIAAELQSVTAAAEKLGVRTRRRQLAWGLVVPAIMAPVAAFGLTGGVESRMVPDLALPIEFTTESGDQIECSIEYFNGELAWVEVNSNAVDFLKAQNWDGIGQQIYDRASQKVSTNDPDILAGTMGMPGGSSDLMNQWTVAWAQAEDELIVSQIPSEMLAPAGLGSDNDCQEQLP